LKFLARQRNFFAQGDTSSAQPTNLSAQGESPPRAMRRCGEAERRAAN